MTPSDRDHPVNRPEFEAAVRGTLVKCGIKPHKLDEEWADVRSFTAEFLILEREKAPSKEQDLSQGRVNALGCGIAANRAIKKGKKEIAQKNREEKGRGEPLSHAAPPERAGEDAMIARMDHQKALGVIGDMLAKGEITREDLEALERKDAGEKRAQIAQDLGKSTVKLDNDAAAARKKIRKVLAIAVPSLAFCVGLVVWLPNAFHTMEPNEHSVAVHADVPGPVNELAEQKAAELRKEALAKCAKQDWDNCENELHATYEMDPLGYSDPAVQQALWDINSVRNEQMKQEMVKAPFVPMPPPKKK
jgi:hypothetical protein